ncbi:MAG: FTR1 family protein [Acidimicrobiia bacterium]
MQSKAVKRVIALIALAVSVLTALAALASPAGAQTAVSRDDAIKQLDLVRDSIDETLQLFRDDKPDQAFEQAKSAYLTHFELVEIPLRVADERLTADAEAQFAEVRNLIREGASANKVKDKIVELRGTIDDAERKLTSEGIGAPSIVMGQSFLIIFREGLEVVLLLSVLLGYLEAAKASHFKKPIMIGIGLAAVLTVFTVIALQTIFAALPVGREILEAVTALVAVAVLFYVSFWLIARIEHKRWMEFLRARVWNAVSVGSATSLALIGFTAVYREGFETALFYQALLSFGSGLHLWVFIGLVLGLIALSIVSFFIFRLGRKLPIKTFMTTAVTLIMVTSVTFLGNAVKELQSADVVGYTRLEGWPRPAIFISQATGYWPTKQTVLAQVILSLVYIAGAVYMFVVRPRLANRGVQKPKTTAAPAA